MIHKPVFSSFFFTRVPNKRQGVGELVTTAVSSGMKINGLIYLEFTLEL